jgi:16S rRNA (guanine527-N7)-methyltransferase
VKDAAARIRRRARRAGLPALGSELVDSLTVYLELLARWNQKINLTSLDDPDDAVDRLVIEPLVAARFLPEGTRSLMDIGSGGGSPAIPLKLARPVLSVRMVESKTRKAAFLREAIRAIGLTETRVETNRYEELLSDPGLHESLDVVTLRAVRVEGRMLMSLQAFVRPGGHIFLFRGPSGPDVPSNLTPPLVFEATHPLVEWLRSRLVVLRKASIGSVPRGTTP